MRPLRLEFQAFGSYPGKEVVDFAALAQRGIFIVSGPTGSGKTTVFDAMVYALFGALPGRRSSYGDPRSHHAPASVDTYVRLEFEVDGERYLVHRAPKQDRPKLRGTGTTERAAEAFLARMVGSGTESISTQTTATTKECERLVGLDAKQFQRVVLLPQGEFTDFLIASDEDRERLLRQLFGGELFEQATQWLKRRVAQLDDEVRRVDNKVEHHRSNAVEALRTARAIWVDDPGDVDIDALGDDELGASIDSLEPERRRRRSTRDRLQRTATTATAASAAAQQAADRFDEAGRTTARLFDLEASRDEAEAHALAVDASRRARPVVAAHDEAESAMRASAIAASALDVLRAQLISAFAAVDRPMPRFDPVGIAAAVAQMGHELAEQGSQLVAAEQATRKADATDAQLAQARELLATVVAEGAGLQSDIAELESVVMVLEPVALESTDRRALHLRACERQGARTQLKATQQQLQRAVAAEARSKSAYEQVMARFVATQAPRLAEQLQPGEPCPVCGSHDHPLPARHAELTPVDHDAVDRARAEWSSSAATVAARLATVDSLREALGPDADRPVAEFDLAVADAGVSLAEADLAVGQLARTRAALQRQRTLRDASARREQQHGLDVATLEGRAVGERADADQLVAVAAGIDHELVATHLAVHSDLSAVTRNVAERFEALTATSTAVQGAQHHLAEALAVSGYPDVVVAGAALLDESREIEMSSGVESWRQALADATTRLAQLHEQGVPPERPEVDVLAAAAHAATMAAIAAADAFTTASNALEASHDELSLALGVAAGSAGLRDERDTARVVFKTCNGEAGMRVKLERWVLAGELERVTAAANVHLELMTNHRYTLSRSGAKGGLTLEVFDAHTGRPRSTASLSGGEQFQASLSLALGLADVVSHGGAASGKRFEALFVDEGFGSLDPDALDDAISALSQLHAAGRTVGAITHVEAMKQRLHVGIEVTPNADGKGSSLHVHP